MAVSLTWSITVTNTSETAATVKVILKAKATNSYNHESPSGYIMIDGTKYSFSHNFSANTTTTLATKSKSISRTTADRSITIKAYFKTGVSSGNLSKSTTKTISARPAYTVTFNAYGGTGGGAATVYYGYTTTFPSAGSRTGYNFVNWAGAYAVGASTPVITGPASFSATWTPITYSIDYNLNGGVSSSTLVTSYNITSGNITLPTPTKEGYKFDGWTGSNGTTATETVIISNGSTGNRTYTANWSLKTYSIILDPGSNHTFPGEDGTAGATKTVTKTHDVSLALPDWGEEPIETSNGAQIFTSWTYEENGETISVGTTYTENVARTLVAEWSDAVRPIILHYAGSTTIDNQIKLNQSFNNAITLPTLTLANYYFKGWSLTQNGSVAYSGNASFTNYSDWFIKTSDTTALEDKAYYVKNNGIFEFLDNISVGDTLPSVTYEINDNPSTIHLYAIWKKKYTIIFNINSPTYDDGIVATIKSGVTSVITSLEVEDNVQSTSTSLPSTANIYEYKDLSGNPKCSPSGWSTSTNGAKVYNDGEQIILTGYEAGYVLNLYVYWEPTKFTLTFIPNKNNLSNYQINNIPYYSTINLPTQTNTGWNPSGYHLYQWVLNNNEYNISTNFLVTENTSFTATWQQNYSAPIITKTEVIRYLDAAYTIENQGGKYLQIHVEGIHGTYTGASPSTHDYDVTVKFYSTTDVQDSTPAVFSTELPTLSISTNTFNQTWGSSNSPIVDTNLDRIYCVLNIKDVTNYGATISDSVRTFTYSFTTNLKRAIALHIANDASAVSVLGELETGDTGFIVKGTGYAETYSGSKSIQIGVKGSYWAWTFDPYTNNMFLKWIGE